MNNPIYVTQPFLPPLEEYLPYLEKIWANKVLTNGGPFHQQLEKELSDYLGVNHISLFTNATIALVSALQALRITGEVITTPLLDRGLACFLKVEQNFLSAFEGYVGPGLVFIFRNRLQWVPYVLAKF